MPASNFEKLIWSYIKNYILGGLAFFFKKETIAITLYIVTLGIALQYELIDFNLVFLEAIVVIIIGLIANKRKLTVRASLILTAILALITTIFYLHILTLPFDLSVSSTYKYYLTVGLLLFWIIFSLTYFIIGIADFFASTAGQFLLWGSDKKRIFFTPLPQLAILAIYLYPSYLFYTGLIKMTEFLYSVAPAMLLTLTIYGLFRNKGRILRNAFAMFSFFSVYLTLAYLGKGSLLQGAIINAFLTVIGVLFMMQARLRDIAVNLPSGETKAPFTPYATLTVFGTIMIFLGFITGTQGYSSQITSIWWDINIVGEIVSIIAAIALLYVTGRVKRYYERDKITTKELLLEIGLIIGKKVIDELVKNISIDLQEVTKKAVEKGEETLEKIRKTVKDVKDFFDKFFK